MGTEEKGHDDGGQALERAYIPNDNKIGDGPLQDDQGSYKPDVASEELQLELSRLELRDDKLKKWIRVLKFVSRALGFILSLATVVPLAMMTNQYLATRNTYYNVNGTSRTAWPINTETVYNNVYLTFSTTSFILNIVILVAYFRGIQQANKVARVAAIWSGILLGVHVVAIVTGVAVYGAGADDKGKNGEDRDLWGWSCSQAAQDIQPFVTETNFEEWCNVQSAAYYVGIANASAAALTLTVYVFAIVRKRSKKKIRILPRRQIYDEDEPINNVTWTPLDRRQSNLRQQCTWSSLDGKEPAVKECTWAPMDDRVRNQPAEESNLGDKQST